MTQEAVGKGPVLFFTDDGLLIQIPLDKIHFNAAGQVSTDGDGPTAAMNKWLAHLVESRELERVKSPAPAVGALKAKAAFDGPEGNGVQIVVKAGANANQVDISVTKIDRYEGLTLANLNARLGTAAVPAPTNTGLLRVKTNAAGAPDPAEQDDVQVDAAGGGGATRTWTLAQSAAPVKAVTLEAKREGVGFDPAHFTVAVNDVVVGTGGEPTRFTLVVTWEREAKNVAAGQIPAALDVFKYLVKFEDPGAGFKLPAPSTSTLVGGREPVAAAAASVTVLAKP